MRTFSTEDGSITYVAGLEEYTSKLEADEGKKREFYIGSSLGGNYMAVPVSNEIRPVNIAVKYLIKAK